MTLTMNLEHANNYCWLDKPFRFGVAEYAVIPYLLGRVEGKGLSCRVNNEEEGKAG